MDLNLNGELLEQFIAEHKPGLVLDPIQSFIPENLRMGDRNAMRKCFTPLLGYGERHTRQHLSLLYMLISKAEYMDERE